MVSTRTKYKFSNGERVLCYEPDRTKAKVLYDSKVLEVKVGKDDRGRKTVEYLIHFQGWNPSWDRCVSEDYVLKDTEENRKLQKDLAAKAQLQCGAYLYRKDQKKKKNTTLSERIFEASNSCSSQEVASAEDPEYLTSTDEDDKESSSTETDDSLEQTIPLELTPAIKSFLEIDFELINRQQKVVKLPSVPNVVEILESYVKYFCSRILRREEDETHRSRSRHSGASQRPTEKIDELDWICARINLCKETVDGLRICFDYYLGSQLLYNVEKSQYEEILSGGLVLMRDVKQEVMSDDENCRQEDALSGDRLLLQPMVSDVTETERRRSLRSHKDPITEPPTCGANGTSKLTSRNLSLSVPAVPNHCSERSTSSTSSCYGPSSSNAVNVKDNGNLTAELAKLLDLTNSWKLVPDLYLNECPPPPSTVYGAVHLARLFVKLPSFLYAANQPEKENQSRIFSEQKLKLLLYHLQLFLTYLESKAEWFGESHYINVDPKEFDCETE